MEFKLAAAKNSDPRMLQQSAMSLGTMNVALWELTEDSKEPKRVVGQAQEI